MQLDADRHATPTQGIDFFTKSAPPTVDDLRQQFQMSVALAKRRGLDVEALEIERNLGTCVL